DTHVSTSIRHGAFEGHLRSPLAMEDLLCQKSNDTYTLPQSWARKLDSLNQAELDSLLKQLAKFTQKFEDIIIEFLHTKLHIRMAGSNKEMFAFDASKEINQELMDSISISTD